MDSKFYTLITGASEGFGRALAIECAQRNMNLILVALPGTILHELADYIRLEYSVDVVCIEKDLCEDESCQEIFNDVTTLELQVNMLVNNAGIGNAGLFEDGSIAFYEKQIKLNVLATTTITRLFLDMLKDNSPSHILNVGSLASFFSLPLKQVYGATKSYVYYFSRSLRKALKKDNVYVSVLCPGGMNTNNMVRLTIQSGNFLSRLSCMDPDKVAPTAIDGLLRRKEVIIPGRLNKLSVVLDSILPAFITRPILDYTLKRLYQNTRFARLRENNCLNGQFNDKVDTTGMYPLNTLR